MSSWRSMALGSLVAVLIVPAVRSATETQGEEPPKLLGRITAQQLEEEPYVEWFREGYDGYEPNPTILAALREVDGNGAALTVFFGTWCPDSRREVPRLLKILDDLEFPPERLTLVAVDNAEEASKRSPGGEEVGLEIYRVPTIVVTRGGREVARFVEHPVLSLERDLLAILSGERYEPSYASYPVIRRWLREGLLADPNVSSRGLAAQVREEVSRESELDAAGRVLLSRGQIREAVALFRVNCALYPDSSRAFARLAKGLMRQGEAAEAREMAEKALRLNTDPDAVDDLVELIAGAKE